MADSRSEVKKVGVRTSILVVSLDFELNWGIRDKIPLDRYREHLLGVRDAIPAMLELFDEYNIHVTWATVGFLFCESKRELTFPTVKPNYLDTNLSPYLHLAQAGRNESEDPYHYAPSLIRLIMSYPHQRIGTHTFSHYYCLEKGQDKEAFQADLAAAQNVAQPYHIELRSLVFPRNQVNPEYLSVCEELGIRSFRGNPESWIYKASPEREVSVWRRGVRLLDSYINLSGHNGHSLEKIQSSFPRNIPASRFLRPYTKKLRLLESLKIRRICSDLTYAARHRLLYHLWWHPHNFGVNLRKNLRNLRKILDHYQLLQQTYGMQSLHMEEVAELAADNQADCQMNDQLERIST